MPLKQPNIVATVESIRKIVCALVLMWQYNNTEPTQQFRETPTNFHATINRLIIERQCRPNNITMKYYISLAAEVTKPRAPTHTTSYVVYGRRKTQR